MIAANIYERFQIHCKHSKADHAVLNRFHNENTRMPTPNTTNVERLKSNEDKTHMMAKNSRKTTISTTNGLTMAALKIGIIFALCAFVRPTTADAEWMNECGICHCKWISSKKMADCKNMSQTGIPKEMSSELQVIDLSFNIIPELRSAEFKNANLPNLHKVYMKSCTLQEINRDAFKTLHLLIELDMSNNFLKVIHAGTFDDVIRLRVLTVQYNQLETLDDGLFKSDQKHS